MSAEQQTLSGSTLPGHLTKNPSAVTQTYAKRLVESDDGYQLQRVRIRRSDLTERECWCLDCQAKVTRESQKPGEAGHAPDCRHTIRRRDSHGLEAWGDQ